MARPADGVADGSAATASTATAAHRIHLTGPTLVLLATVTLVWGANWPLMKFSLREMTPLWFRATTMACGGLLLLGWYAARGVDLRLPRAAWAPVAILAAPNILGWHLFAILGVQELASGRAAILGFTMPIWTVLMAVLLFGERLTRRAAVSALCGAVAVGLLVWHEVGVLAGRPVGVLWMQLAAVSWALGTLMMRRSTLTLPTPALTVWMLLMSSAVLTAMAAALEPLPAPQRFSAPMWASLAWAAAINYGAAQIAWFGLARVLPATAVGFAIMAVPLVGTFSAVFITGERPHVEDLVAAGFVVAAIAGALLPAPARRTG